MVSDERVEVALEELQDLKGVWNELLKIWEKIDELKEQPWLSVQPRKVGVLTHSFSDPQISDRFMCVLCMTLREAVFMFTALILIYLLVASFS